MGAVNRISLSLTTDGAGAASAVTNFGFNSEYRRLVRVYADFDATAAAGTVLTVTDGDGVAALTTTGNTDFDNYLTDAVVTKAKAAVTNGATAPLVRGPLTVTLASGGAAKTTTVRLWLEK